METFSLQAFGERIKQIRLDAGFDGRDDQHSMRAFCRRFNEDPSVWSELERARRPQPPVTTLARLCEKFDRSPTWLLYGRGHERLSIVGLGAELPKSAKDLIDKAGTVILATKSDPARLDRLKQQLYALTVEEKKLIRGLLDEHASRAVSDDTQNNDETAGGHAGGKHSRRIRPVVKTPRGRKSR